MLMDCIKLMLSMAYEPWQGRQAAAQCTRHRCGAAHPPLALSPQRPEHCAASGTLKRWPSARTTGVFAAPHELELAARSKAHLTQLAAARSASPPLTAAKRPLTWFVVNMS